MTERRRRGRPPVSVDIDRAGAMLRNGAVWADAEALLGVSRRTLLRRSPALGKIQRTAILARPSAAIVPG